MPSKRGAESDKGTPESEGRAYLRTEEVAQALGVSKQTVVNWSKKGELEPTRTVGGHRRFRPHDVIALARAKDLPVPPEFVALSTRRVLLVDDDLALSESVVEFFLEAGLDVQFATNWFDFGRAVERHSPAIVLLDIDLPGGSGVDVPQLLRKDPKSRHIQVIAWMGASDDATHERVRRSQFADVVYKPAHLGELLQRVQTLLA